MGTPAPRSSGVIGSSSAAGRSNSGQKRKVAVRETTLSDYGPVAALQSKYGLPPKGYEEWKELWLNNPVYGAATKSSTDNVNDLPVIPSSTPVREDSDDDPE